MSKRHILVLGATGPSGVLFCEAALRDGHPLTLYVRNPSKLPTDIAENTNVKVIKGDLTSKEGLESAIAGGATALASFLGPGPGHKGTPLTDAYKLIFPLLTTHNYTRALILSTASWSKGASDTGALKWKALVGMVYLMAGNSYGEINALSDYIAAIPTSDTKWTMFRVPILSDAEAKETKAGPLDGKAGLKLSRKSMAEWVLREIGEEKWVGQAACIWN